MNVQRDILIIIETWMKEGDKDLHEIPGYQHFYVYRKDKRGGGVSIFTKKDIDASIETESTKLNKDLELVTIKMYKTTGTKNNIILAVYRPPNGDPVEFMEQLGEILNKYDISKNNVYVAGDFNINLANFESDKIVHQFLDLMGSYSLTPLNNIPTRISKTTASIIDNIFTNTNNVLMTKVIVLDISHHYMLYTKITEKAINTAPEEDNLVWNFKRPNIILFQNKIKQTDFSYINSMEQVKLAYSNLPNRIVNTFEGTFRKVSLKGKYKNRLPWLTVRLRNMIKIKNKLYYKSIRRPTPYKSIQIDLSKPFDTFNIKILQEK